jgi:hypothetical protein
LSEDADVAVRWFTVERMAALKQIVPQGGHRSRAAEVRARDRTVSAVAAVVWFVIAMTLFCRDSDRQRSENQSSCSIERYWR